MRALPVGAALSVLSTVLNFGPLAQAQTSTSNRHDSLRMTPPSASFQHDRRCWRERALDRQIEADQLFARDDEVGLVHMGALDGEDAVRAPIDRALRQLAHESPPGTGGQHAAIGCRYANFAVLCHLELASL